MQIHPQKHLSYCTNIHPAETWPDVLQSLQRHVVPLKQTLSPDQPFGIGLRLSNRASLGLDESGNRAAFKEWLQENDAYVFTMNGFPYGGFHRQVVKDQVHAPDWRTRERLAYTQRLFYQLADLLPPDTEGGISTSPLSYKPWLKTEAERETAFGLSTDHLLQLVDTLHQIHEQEGKVLHLDIEPEPDGLLENSNEFIHYYNNWLLPRAKAYFQSQFSASKTEEVIRRHIQLCYDVCHFAVGYEDPESTIDTLLREDIHIGKIQISAALKAMLPAPPAERLAIKEAFSPFNESTYLHQVIARKANGQLQQFPDLTPALATIDQSQYQEWRTHFHVPVFVEQYGLLSSTQSEIVKVLNHWKEKPFCNHLEVETYTWEVLPADLQTDLTHCISRELEWVLRTLNT